MAKFSYSDIEGAFDFMNSGSFSENLAVINKNTGKILYKSDYSDIDEISDNEEIENEEYVCIPEKNELGLGKDLVFKFVANHLPDDYDFVEQFFRQRGAYSKYKSFLEKKGLLQKWYDFEDQSRKVAILEWCRENGIDVEE